MPQNLYHEQSTGINKVALTVILPLLTLCCSFCHSFNITSGFGMTGSRNWIFTDVSERSDLRKALTVESTRGETAMQLEITSITLSVTSVEKQTVPSFHLHIQEVKGSRMSSEEAQRQRRCRLGAAHRKEQTPAFITDTSHSFILPQWFMLHFTS